MRSQGVRILLPVLVIAPLVWLMVGCVYIPWFEQAQLYGAKRDFRDLSGKSPADPIVDGRITKEQVLRLLGKPAAQSPNGRVIAYTLTTQHGIWIQPLCFYATPGGRYEYAMGLRFTADGVLEHHSFVTQDVDTSFVFEAPTPPEIQAYYTRQMALAAIDRDNGVVHPGQYRRDQPPSKVGVREDFAVAKPDPFSP